jgi:hypothetical protein
MRLPAPRIPPAASAAFGAAYGPRVLPGTYTVKMTKDKQVYTTQLRVIADPRSTHTAEDRQRQFDLAVKLSKLLGEMSFDVDKINEMRLALDERAAKLSPEDPLRKRLQDASAQVDVLRKKIVATKEGGAITGEERLREFLTNLYGDVNFYEGRPSQTQEERADSLARELTDVVKDFVDWAAKKKLEPIKILTRDEWEKVGQRPTSSPSPAALRGRDRDEF